MFQKKIILFLIIIFSLSFFVGKDSLNNQKNENMKEEIILPQPVKEGDISLEEVLDGRRSIRSFKDEGLSLKEISQILWSSQGITGEKVKRTAPSAGATYPLKVYLVVRKAEGLNPGIYLFVPEKNMLKLILEKEVSEDLMNSALGQNAVGEAPVNVVFSAVYERTTDRYGERGHRYVHMEAGHASQNVYLQSESLGLGTVVIGAFNDNLVSEVLNLPKNEDPLYIMPVGKK